MKLKLITALIVSMFLVSFITVTVATPVKAAEKTRFLMIDIMAKGDDLDIPGATFSFIGKIEVDKVSDELLGRVEFHIKIYDESGEKIYSMKGKLKDAPVMILPAWPCDVRNVIWTNLWFVQGLGEIKTTDTDITILYRNQLITLPNTHGKYVEMSIAMLISQNGEHDDGVLWPEGGWAFAGIAGFVGGVTYLTKYMEKLVP